MEILLGAGSRPTKLLRPRNSDWSDLVRLDINEDHKPDVVHDLMNLPLPFADDSADEIHAYDVMEHLGAQGDWRWFFAQWADIWRVLRPDGFFCGISPHWQSQWAWGDPGHTRIVGAEQLVFLDQEEYSKQVGQTPMTDYRFCYKADFRRTFQQEQSGAFIYILQAVKPARLFFGKAEFIMPEKGGLIQ